MRGHDRGHEAADRRGPAAAAGRRDPGAAEPVGLVGRAGAGGSDGPRRPQRQRRPHLARASVPVAVAGAQAPARRGACLERAAVRLPRVHRPRVGGPAGARRDQEPLLVVHPAPRLRPPRRAVACRRPRASSGGTRAGGTRAHARRADGAVRRAAPDGDRGHARRRGRASVRAGGRDRDVRRQPQHQRLQHLHRRLRVLRVRAVAALARRVRPLRGGFRAPRPRGGRRRCDGDLHAVGDPSRLGAGGV